MSTAQPRSRVYDPAPPPAEIDVEIPAPSTPFPMHCLPPVAEEMGKAICAATGVPESLAGPAVLGIISAAIGKGLVILSAPQRTSRANLYICASAVSGSGKSETMRMAAAPLIAFEREVLATFYKDTLPDAEADIELLQVEMAKLKKLAGKDLTQEGRLELQDEMRDKKLALAEAEASSQAPALTVEDITVEKLAVLLSLNGETLSSVSSDAGAIVNNLLGRYVKTDRTDESLYLKTWTGESCKVDRQGRDNQHHVVNDRPAYPAAEALKPLPSGCHRERRRFLLVERAEGHEGRSRFLKRQGGADHLDDVAGVRHLLNDLPWN